MKFINALFFIGIMILMNFFWINESAFAVEQTFCAYKVDVHVFYSDANYTLSLTDSKGNDTLVFNKALDEGDIITFGSFISPIADAMVNNFTDINETDGTFKFDNKNMKFFKQDATTASATSLKDIAFPFDSSKSNPCFPSEEFSQVYYPYNDIYYFGVSIGAYDPFVKDSDASESPVDGNDAIGQGNINGTGSGKPNEFVTKYGSRLNKLGDKTLPAFLGRIIKTAMGVMGSIALVMITYGGVLWMTAHGSADKSHKALMIILWSSAGLGVIFASYALVDIIFEVFR